MTGALVCPPVALDAGVGLLCRLFHTWGQAAAGVLALTEWLLGDKEAGEEAVADDAPVPVRSRLRGLRGQRRLDDLD